MSRGFTFPDVVLEQHLAVLGKTGAGKSHTARLVIEQAVATGARVCILDPIKSDWWGLTSSTDGRQAGLPFRILGGPHGHVPLHSSAGKAIADVVATGALPLSIVDMADFEPGGSSRFFVDFAQTLLRKMRGVVYLVLEEAHLFAPKERSGIGQESLAIHWAKTLATAGRSKGIRLVLVTQRTQALHNALLGSCDTVIAHRLTAPADQAPVISWLKANTSKSVLEQVTSSLSSLKTGEGWICAGEAKLFSRVHFPRITTYDNTATPTGAGETHEVTTAAVDADQLRALIGTAVEQAKQDDPKELRRLLALASKEAAASATRISELEATLARTASASPAATQDVPVLTEADRTIVQDLAAALAETRRLATVNTAFDVDDLLAQIRARLEQFKADVATEMHDVAAAMNAAMADPGFQRILDRLLACQPETRTFGRRFEALAARPAPARREGPASAGLEGAQQAILDVIAMLGVRGITPTRETVARWLAIHPNGGRYGSNLAFLRANDYLEGCELTAKGHAAARALETGLEAAKRPLDGSQAQIVDVLALHDGKRFTRETLAKALGLHPNGGRYGSNLARLRTMGLIPERGDIYLTDGARR